MQTFKTMKTTCLLMLTLAAFSFTIGGCVKTNDPAAKCVSNTTGVPTAAEITALQTYLASKSITATQDPRGFFYVIHAQGTGATPVSTSVVTVKYTGKLFDGTIFDENQTGNAIFYLSNLVQGWKMGLPLIQKGGSISLYIPPTLGYGCTPQTYIPAGSSLDFTIDLINVQ